MGKMTDGQVELMLGRCAEPMRSTLRAHIAALEAERDKWRDRCEDTFLEAKHAKEERDEALKDAESADAAAVRNVEEWDALRERVKTLEEEKDERQRQKWGWMERCRKAKSRLAAMQQRAFEVDESLKPTGVSVASYILGPDAPAPSEMDGLEGEMAEASRCDGCGHCRACISAYQEEVDEAREPPAEPSTAEAFAELRGTFDLTGDEDGEEVGEVEERVARLLSLLERRMGAMERVILPFEAMAAALVHIRTEAFDDEVVRRTPLGGDATHVLTIGDCRALVAALTGAPPVFTLEEVENAMSRADVRDLARRAVVSILKDCRK